MFNPCLEPDHGKPSGATTEVPTPSSTAGAMARCGPKCEICQVACVKKLQWTTSKSVAVQHIDEMGSRTKPSTKARPGDSMSPRSTEAIVPGGPRLSDFDPCPSCTRTRSLCSRVFLLRCSPYSQPAMLLVPKSHLSAPEAGPRAASDAQRDAYEGPQNPSAPSSIPLIAL